MENCTQNILSNKLTNKYYILTVMSGAMDKNKIYNSVLNVSVYGKTQTTIIKLCKFFYTTCSKSE